MVLVEDTECEVWNEITYEWKDGVLTFSGRGRVGKEYEGGESASEEVWSIYKETTEKIVFKKGITAIGQFTFMNFKNVKEVLFPCVFDKKC